MASNPEINVAPRDPAWKQKANAFWRWWTGELVKLVPERFAMLHGGDRAPLVAIDSAEAAIVDGRPGTTAQRVDLAGMDEARRRAAVRSLLERAGETRMRGRAVLGPQDALVRRVAMPAATEENLRQVLAFEMDRLTPFRAEDVYFDYRVLSRDAAAGQILLQLAVARRDVVDARVQALRALGVSVQGVGLREDAAPGAGALDLLPSEQRGERDSPRERMVQRGLVVAVVLLLAAALILPLLQKRAHWLALNPEVESARAKAESTSAVSSELDRQVADYNFLLGRKQGTWPALAVLEDVTRLLPDNTWVQQMDIRTVGKTREVQIVGETASASKLIEILESSTLLQNAAFRGTVTRGSVPNTERFMIAAEIRPRPQPEPRPLLEVAGSMPAVPQAGRLATPPPAPVTPAGASNPEATPATVAVPPPVTAPPPAPVVAPAPAHPAATGPFPGRSATPQRPAPAGQPVGPSGVVYGPDGWPVTAPLTPPPPPQPFVRRPR